MRVWALVVWVVIPALILIVVPALVRLSFPQPQKKGGGVGVPWVSRTSIQSYLLSHLLSLLPFLLPLSLPYPRACYKLINRSVFVVVQGNDGGGLDRSAAAAVVVGVTELGWKDEKEGWVLFLLLLLLLLHPGSRGEIASLLSSSFPGSKSGRRRRTEGGELKRQQQQQRLLLLLLLLSMCLGSRYMHGIQVCVLLPA